MEGVNENSLHRYTNAWHKEQAAAEHFGLAMQIYVIRKQDEAENPHSDTNNIQKYNLSLYDFIP